MARPRPRTSDPAVALGHRSGLEDRQAERLSDLGVPYEYESIVIPYVKRPATYRPDFLLLSNGILIETKGYFLAEDRTKHLLVKEQHPDLDIRFVFSRARNPLRKGSRTTYATWAEKNGFAWAEGDIPQAWIDEAPQAARMAAVDRLRKTAK
ncbi:MAG TPA: hypothetical protein VNR89_03960 [Roseomonas sp.]|nr:hypothetical protein [Roseomonas sp.]